MTRRAFLILGAERAGTRFVASIFRAAGCMGKITESGNWQQWDETPPTMQTPIVWQRSFPHGSRLHTVSQMLRPLDEYYTQAVVMTRDPYCVRRSQARFRTPDELEANLYLAYPMIFAGLSQATIPYILLPYESFIPDYEQMARWLLDYHELPSDIELPEFVNGNLKWYAKEQSEEVT